MQVIYQSSVSYLYDLFGLVYFDFFFQLSFKDWFGSSVSFVSFEPTQL